MTTRLQPLQWSEALATGIDLVDEQHRQLLDIFNRAATALTQAASAAELGRLLDALVDYTHYHFREEAQLMAQWPIDAGHRAMHLRAHHSFSEFLRQARALAQSHPSDVGVDLLAFLAQWLLHHIAGVDARMAREIRALQAGDPPLASAAPSAHPAQLEQLVDAVSQLTDALGQRTFDLLSQRQKLLELQGLYRALLHSGEVLIQSRNEQDMLQSLCAKLSRETPFHASWIGRPGPSCVFEILAVSGEGAGQVREAPPRLTHDAMGPVVVQAWNSGTAVACNDTLADPRLQPWHQGFMRNRWLSVMAVPITRAQKPWAVLVFAAARQDVFDERTSEVCLRIGELLGFGLDELDLKKRIQTLQSQEAHMARTDSLTQLPNRFAFEEHLPRAMARAQRGSRVLAVGMIDLDDFKPVNDSYGHDAGDALLRSMALRLRDNLRESDFVARLGGDEFAIVLEDLDAQQALPQLGRALARLHRAVERPFDLGQGRSVEIGMTLGVALYPGDAVDADSLLRKADAAMYQAKQGKADRSAWWLLSSSRAEESLAEPGIDPFGREAQQLLGELAPGLDAVSARFAAALSAQMQHAPESAAILRSLGQQQRNPLGCLQDGPLRVIGDTQASATTVQQAFARIGRVHALLGVSGAWMTQAMELLRLALHQQLDSVLLSPRTRYRALRVVEARLQLAMHTLLQAMREVADAYALCVGRPFEPRLLVADAMQSELDALAALPGVCAAMLFRPDASNRFLIEQASGAVAGQFIEVFIARELHPLVDPLHPRGQGLVAMTWMSEQAQQCISFADDARTRPWQQAMSELGIASALTVPLHREGEIHAVLGLFGAHPHQFASSWMQLWRASLQSRLGQMMGSLAAHVPPIAVEHKLQVRELLHGGALQLVVQPVVDLRSGAVRKVEALARLRGADGSLLPPAAFLPALGSAELHLLLRQGLRMGLAQLRAWQRDGLDVGLSLNLAPSSLVHADCLRWVEEALAEAGVEPALLTLELLEGEPLQAGIGDAAIRRLAALGVRIAMDDLGSGYSSLQRLAELPFHVIKIDRSIVRELNVEPLKALSLIRSTVQIGQDFEREVVAEGLEDAGLVEAACLLGCAFGQGYALARPMSPQDLPSWIAGYRPQACDPGRLRSWVAALAYQWMLSHDPIHLQHPGSLDDCPMSDFLRGRAVQDSQVLHWHDQAHHAADEDARRQAMRHLLQWLAVRARAPD